MISKLLSSIILLILFASSALADFEDDLSVSADYPHALRELRARASAGDAYAQLNMGGIFIKGEKIEQDYSEAMKWFRLAAEQGLAQAQYNLAMMYASGQSVKQDYTQALSWYQRAAFQSLPQAQLNLGVFYANGLGVEKDETEAIKWFRLAAERGEPQAQFNLGVMYANGQGVEKDLLESYRWTRLAADQGHLLARNLMADLANQMTPEQTVLAAKLAVPAKNTLSSDQAGENSLAVEIAEKSIRQDIRIWANAWSAKRMQAYFDAYITAYKPEGMSHAQWKAQRTAHINKPNTITLDLRNMIIKVVDDTHASVSFTQNYRSDIHQDLQKKTLQMIKSKGRWLISAEQTERPDVMPLMRNHKIH